MRYRGHITLRKTGFFLLFFFFHFGLSAQKTDIIILSNGDRVTCEIKEMILGSLKVKTDDMRTLEIDWSHVKSLRSDQVFEVRMSDGMTYYASFDTTSRPGKIALVTQFEPEYRSYRVNMRDIVSIVQLKNIIWSRFKGDFSLGLGISKANQLRSFHANAQLEYTSRKINSQIHYTTNRSHTRGESQNIDQSLMLSGYHYVAKKWVIGSTGGLDKNTELGLKNRVSLSLEGGYFIVQTNRQWLVAITGIQGTTEQQYDSTFWTYNIEGVLTLRYNIFKFQDPKINIRTGADLYPSLTDPGRVRTDLSVSASVEIFKNFTVGLDFYFKMDNRSAEGASKTDYNLNMTFGYKFNK